MNRMVRLASWLLLAAGMLWSNQGCLAARAGGGEERPIVIVAADKMDSGELFGSSLPAIHRLLSGSASGLMNSRSDNGLYDSASSYLTIGAGIRSTYPAPRRQPLPQVKLGRDEAVVNLRHWSLGAAGKIAGTELGLAEIGWVRQLALQESQPETTGRLGALLARHGWRTCLIGNLDTPQAEHRPGGLLVMNERGVVDAGMVDSGINETDPDFPYGQRFSSAKSLAALRANLAPRRVILIEWGDFYRLDLYQEEMMPPRYEKLKEKTWRRFDRFIGQLLKLQEQAGFALIVTGPSVSRKGVWKSFLEPLVIRDPDFSSGLLTSGTTKWPGVVANVDLAPTLLRLAGVTDTAGLTGRVVTVQAMADPRPALERLNERLAAVNGSRRTVLDWYMGLISFGWIAGWLCLWQRWKGVGGWLLSGVLAIPLVLIVLPLAPPAFWGLAGFLTLTLLLTVLALQIKPLLLRVTVLSFLTWGILIVDQLLGWQLIRFSALGYSAAAGARYYGMGNEFMGPFIASALLLGDLLRRYTRRNWPVLAVLGITLFVLSWPQLGAKFGGIIAGTVAFSFYLVLLYRLHWRDKRLWLVLAGGFAVLLTVGLWDFWRHPDQQTHIGRFVGLFFSKRFVEVGMIIGRKIEMDIKLTLFSPWMRIILLALGVGVVNRLILRQGLLREEDRIVWRAILVGGLTAYAMNDAGVLAFATCLAFGFTYLLLRRLEALRQGARFRFPRMRKA
ncbi:hypothetical protein EDC14_101722 [Hydrogenispora ethanolica]|uniref:Phosphoglyceromutase n=2 Tax=Hydrogenispora ethanolica TaxID=1082276 RepID=A0A4R1RGW3_HYDET|nr:hypothetical protein EDC14_101722 [Hydrogenispora ethanolica]